MALKLDGKVIVVAGAGGIGAGIAMGLAAEGATIVLGDLSLDSAARTAEQIVANGGRAIATAFDGADENSSKDLIGLAVSRFGGIDGIHINYAYLIASPHTDLLGQSIEEFDEAMRVNARGYLLCTRQAVPALLARGGGSIVSNSSATSLRRSAKNGTFLSCRSAFRWLVSAKSSISPTASSAFR